MKLANRIYFSVMHLYNKRKLFVISSLIILVGIIACFHTLTVYYSVNYNFLQLRQLFGNRRGNLYKIENGYVLTDYEYYETYRDFLLEMREDYNINLFENTTIYPKEMMSSELEDLLQRNATEADMQNYGGRIPISFFKIDNDFLYAAGIQNENGGVLELGTRPDGSMEVAIGPLYKELIHIGDTFEDPYTGQRYVIACILAEGQKWVSGTISDHSGIILLDNCFIAPVDLQNYTDYGTTTYLDNVYLYSDQEQAEQQIEAIEHCADEQGIYIDIMSYSAYESSLKEENRMLYFFSLMLAVMMLVTVLVVSVIFSVITWLLDYHDIGILYANGFLQKDLFLIILQENMLRILIPALVSYAYVCMFEFGNGLSAGYINRIFLLVILIYIIVLLLCSIGSYYFISRYAPTELLKGEGI